LAEVGSAFAKIGLYLGCNLGWTSFEFPEKSIVSLQPYFPEDEFGEDSPQSGDLDFFISLERADGIPILEKVARILGYDDNPLQS
jgi:hypothetical protein